jgi:AcrR family transcriptional regulator
MLGRTMQTVTSFSTSAVSREELGAILQDYLSLERARVFRRLLVTRFGFLALLAAIIAAVTHELSLFARCFTVGLFLTPPTWAWMTELRLMRRLARRLDGVDGAVTHQLAEPGQPGRA